ncbi:putative membrane protein [Mammaliicoccus virus vB_MscM-PMS2]|nr:putative membrane protein [Mammaliicoccus virus vB_MscM-PMS2]
MNIVLKFVMYYMLYLVAWLLGLWFLNLVTEADINPLTIWVPYVLSLVLSLKEVLISEED